MEKKVRITINGQNFEFPIDMSLFTGMMGSMAPHPIRFGAIQSSHQRLEGNFFRRIEQDLKTYQNFGDCEDVRILGAIIALHRRVKRLEEKCLFNECVKEIKEIESKPEEKKPEPRKKTSRKKSRAKK